MLLIFIFVQPSIFIKLFVGLSNTMVQPLPSIVKLLKLSKSSNANASCFSLILYIFPVSNSSVVGIPASANAAAALNARTTASRLSSLSFTTVS